MTAVLITAVRGHLLFDFGESIGFMFHGDKVEAEVEKEVKAKAKAKIQDKVKVKQALRRRLRGGVCVSLRLG